jgi:hypothetical protein
MDMKQINPNATIQRICILSLLLLVACGGWSQQLRVSNTYLFFPTLMNPASVGARGLNDVFLSHQQRHTAVAGFRSSTQFLNISSQPLGKKGIFGIGGNVNSDFEWTEFRLGFNFAFGAAIVRTKNFRFSLGGNIGILNWGSNYSKVAIHDDGDELLVNPGNFVELDAGVGAEMAVRTKNIRADFNVMTQQMPSNAFSRQLPGTFVFPHIFAGAGFLFRPVHNLLVGPRAFFREIIMSGDTTIGGLPADSLRRGRFDIGARAEFEQEHLWFGGMYRPRGHTLTMALGLRIINPDTTHRPDLYAYFVDLNASVALSLGQTSQFGPAFEMGVKLSMGRGDRGLYVHDTLRESPGPFWWDNGTVNDHMVAKLKPNGPEGLRAKTERGPKSVVLTYRFDDNSYQYVGNTPAIVNDTLIQTLGPEWVGVDAILENMVGEVIHEGLTPDTLKVLNPEVLEALDGLISIELSTNLLVDEQQADQEAKGMMYEGELGTNNGSKDSLYIKVVYNDVDTIVGIGRDRQITNLELACLKLHAMRKKLEYELNQKYGDVWAVYWEGEDQTVEKTQGRRVVYLKKPRITPNNPNQDAFQVNMVKLRFARKGNGIQVDQNGEEKLPSVETSRRKQKRNRQNQERIRDRVN